MHSFIWQHHYINQSRISAPTCLGLSPAACMKVAPLRLCAATASRRAARAAQPPRTRCAHRHTAQAPHSSRNRMASEDAPLASRKDADSDGCRHTKQRKSCSLHSVASRTLLRSQHINKQKPSSVLAVHPSLEAS